MRRQFLKAVRHNLIKRGAIGAFLLYGGRLDRFGPTAATQQKVSNSTPTTSQVGKVDPVPASSLNVIQYSNQQPNLSHLSGKEGGPCPSFELEWHSNLSLAERLLSLTDLVRWLVTFKLDLG